MRHIFPKTPREHLKETEEDIFSVVIPTGIYKDPIVMALKSRYSDRMMGRFNVDSFKDVLTDKYNFLFPRYSTAFSMYARYANDLDEVEGHIRTLVSASVGQRGSTGNVESSVDKTGNLTEASTAIEHTEGTSDATTNNTGTTTGSKTDEGTSTEGGDTETVNQNLPDVPLGAVEYASNKSKILHNKTLATGNESNETTTSESDETSATTIVNDVDSSGSVTRESIEGSSSSTDSIESVNYNEDVDTREINAYKSRAEMLKDAMSNITNPYEMFAFEFDELFINRW